MQNILNKTKVEHINRAFLIIIVGTGICTASIFAGSGSKSMIVFLIGASFTSLLYIVASIFSLSSVVAVYRINQPTQELYPVIKKIFITIFGSLLFVLSLSLGVYGFLNISWAIF